jgi:toxin ParE1/3/4
VIAYVFHPDAAAELEEAAMYYEANRTGLGKAFADEVEHTLSLIRQFPEAGISDGPDRRRAIVARFPYSLIYRQTPSAIVVIAVAHQRRRPGYWRRRK